jgi:hypothetical protein
VPRGSLRTVIDELVAVEQAIAAQAREVYAANNDVPVDTIGEVLNVYRWWRPDMLLPAVWLWMTPGDVEGPAGAGEAGLCRVRGWARVTMSIGVDPTATPGAGEMLELEEYADLALPLVYAAVYSRNPLGQREARARGFQTVADELGGASILTLELPVEVALDVNAVPSTP